MVTRRGFLGLFAGALPCRHLSSPPPPPPTPNLRVEADPADLRPIVHIKAADSSQIVQVIQVDDHQGAPISWLNSHGGWYTTDDVTVQTSAFSRDRVSMRRWTDQQTLEGPGGFSFDSSDLVKRNDDGTFELMFLVDTPGSEPLYVSVDARANTDYKGQWPAQDPRGR